ncbi:MAG: hypothetical protein CVU78_03410 [Elusimicrobia bacterium HGW-Elusimicrobia-2]|nr:MAG: hypothetical protein CVU78_03410 [Elusimicrobia bacterium HGW-Elusimicrobia-2]
MRIILFSTSDDFIRNLPRVLLDAGSVVPAVVTGSGTEVPLLPGIKNLRPGDVNSREFIEELKSFHPDLFVVVSFGRIFSEDFLAVPELGAVNIHFSLLPAYRGAAPIEWAVFNGEKRTGITVFKICRELDAGDIINAKSFDIAEGESAPSLYSRLAKASPDVIRESIRLVEEPAFRPSPQEGLASFARRLEKKDGLVDFRKDSAELIYRKVLAFSGKINITSIIRGESVIIKEARVLENAVSGAPGTVLSLEKDNGFSVNCASGALLITSVQPAGKKRMSGWEFVLGRRLSPGDQI